MPTGSIFYVCSTIGVRPYCIRIRTLIFLQSHHDKFFFSFLSAYFLFPVLSYLVKQIFFVTFLSTHNLFLFLGRQWNRSLALIFRRRPRQGLCTMSNFFCFRDTSMFAQDSLKRSGSPLLCVMVTLSFSLELRSFSSSLYLEQNGMIVPHNKKRFCLRSCWSFLKDMWFLLKRLRLYFVFQFGPFDGIFHSLFYSNFGTYFLDSCNFDNPSQRAEIKPQEWVWVCERLHFPCRQFFFISSLH